MAVTQPLVLQADVHSPVGAGLTVSCVLFMARLIQIVCSVAGLYMMWATGDFHHVTPFRYFLVVVSVQILWSGFLAAISFYLQRHLHTQVLWGLTIGDGVISALLFSVSCGCFGMVLASAEDPQFCAQPDCIHSGPTTVAAVLTLISWVGFLPTFFHSFKTLATRSS